MARLEGWIEFGDGKCIYTILSMEGDSLSGMCLVRIGHVDVITINDGGVYFT